MAITMEAIKKLRAMTGAGLADVKKALTEAEGDMDKAKDILRQSQRYGFFLFIARHHVSKRGIYVS